MGLLHEIPAIGIYTDTSAKNNDSFVLLTPVGPREPIKIISIIDF